MFLDLWDKFFSGGVSNRDVIITRLLIVIFLCILTSSYWICFNFAVRFLNKKTKNYKIFIAQRLVLTGFTIFITILTLIIAFIDNLALFFGSISVLSAALVFALQDFVSCFFAWIFVETTGQYEKEDVIMIHSDGKVASGVVNEVGLFRTSIRERLGGETLDRERPTGKIVTFPNNFIFKHSLTNLTKNHHVLWHSFQVVVTFETDYKKTNQVLEQVMHESFNILLLKPERYFDVGIGDLNNFRPKVYHNIETNGVGFTIWFGCRVGALRPVMEFYSSAILDIFNKYNIDLAYNTTRMIHLDPIITHHFKSEK